MNGLNYSIWIDQLRALFPVADEYQLAAAIYPFQSDHEAGMTPRQSYNAFDAWVSQADEAA